MVLPHRGDSHSFLWREVRAVQKGRDCVVYLPKGLEYKVLPSRTLKLKAKYDTRKDGGIIFLGRKPKFEQVGTDYVTFIPGPIPGTITIGLPDGFEGKQEAPPEKK